MPVSFAPKRAGNLRDHDEVDGKGRVQWTAGNRDGTILVAFNSHDGRQYQETFAQGLLVQARRT